MTDIKLIAIDLDGTLLDSNRELSEENYQAIQDAKAAGIQVVLCTGRPLRSMNYLLDEIGLKGENDLAITYNGGLIQKTKTGEVVHELTLDRKDSLSVYEMATDFNLPVNFIDLDYIYEPPYPKDRDSLYNKAVTNIPEDQALQFKAVDIEKLPNPFKINKIVLDVLDYLDWTTQDEVRVNIEKKDGQEWVLDIVKAPDEDLGIIFDEPLIRFL